MTKFNYFAAISVGSALLFATARIVAGAVNGFTTWEQGGQTNTIRSGDIFGATIIHGTASNIGTSTIKFTVGGGNAALTNNLAPQSADFYADSWGTVTNPAGFYYPLTFYDWGQEPFGPTLRANSSPGLFSVEFVIGYSTGTGAVATVMFQGYNPGPTNLVVPLQMFSISVSRSGGSWGTPGAWTTRSVDYGNTPYTWVRILAPPSPQVAGIAHDAGNSTMRLTVNLDPGTSNVVLYCTELGGSETPVTSIVIPMDAPDKVTTNITVDAPGQKGFWRVKSIR